MLGCVVLLILVGWLPDSAASAASSSRKWTPDKSPSTSAAPPTCAWTPPPSRVAEFEEFVKNSHPGTRAGDDRQRDRPRSRLVGGLHGQLRPAGRRRPHPAERGAQQKRRRNTPASCGTTFEEAKQFADLRVSFDTGGMVSTALNNGASSPIDIQVTGGSREQGLALATQIKNRVAGVKGVVDARVLQRLDAPYLFINVNREKAAAVGLSPVGGDSAGGGGHEFQHLARSQFLDRCQERQSVFRGRAVSRKPHHDARMTCSTSRPRGPIRTIPVKLSSLAQFKRSTGAVEINHDSLAARLQHPDEPGEAATSATSAKEVQTSLKRLAGRPRGCTGSTKTATIDKLVKDNSAARTEAAKASRKPHNVSRWPKAWPGRCAASTNA